MTSPTHIEQLRAERRKKRTQKRVKPHTLAPPKPRILTPSFNRPSVRGGNRIVLPNEWKPRLHQYPLWEYLHNGGRRATVVWHRRAGKDSTAINWTAEETARHPGVYWHLAPTTIQARRIVWDNVTDGRKVIDQAFPLQYRKRTDNQMMTIETQTGSIWQVTGSDNYDSLVGGNVRGVVFSEWPLADPASWDYIRPILLENGGWAIFIYTPRGRNHGFRTYKIGLRRDDWFSQLLTVNDTYREDGSRIITPEMIQSERDEGMSEAKIKQEYFCSFAAGMVGAFYGERMEKIRKEGAVTSVPFNPNYPVQTYWDLGIGKKLCIWFGQRIGYEYRWIDFYSSPEGDLQKAAQYFRTLPYQFSRHVLPHDAGQRSIKNSETRQDFLEKHGVRPCEVLKQTSVADGITAVQEMLDRSVFDETKCEAGIDGLESYRRSWDEKKQIFLDQPLHDWASHPADAFRTAAMAADDPDDSVIGDPEYTPKGSVYTRGSHTIKSTPRRGTIWTPRNTLLVSRR